MTLNRKERERIEKIGTPYIVAAMVTDWEAEIDNIEMVTDRFRQYKGEDFVISDSEHRTVVDSKYHRGVAYQQELTDTGVDIISIEITKKNGRAGWGIDTTLNTDYIIDMIHGVGYYMIDSKRLKEYMADAYEHYPVMYAAEGEEDYRAVSVADLMEYEVILYFKEFSEIENKAWAYIRGYDSKYNEKIQPSIDKLLT